MYVGFRGRWRCRTAWLPPDHWAWTVYTTTEPNHFLFDGRVARSFAGTQEMAVDAGPETPLRSQARFMAVVHLDALRLPGVSVQPLGPADLPAGASAGLVVVRADDGTRYRLGFDAAGLVVWAEGPVALPPLGAGVLGARFADFRRVGGFRLPFRAAWTLDGAPLADERALAVCPDPVGLGPAAFASPHTLPSCDGPG